MSISCLRFGLAHIPVSDILFIELTPLEHPILIRTKGGIGRNCRATAAEKEQLVRLMRHHNFAYYRFGGTNSAVVPAGVLCNPTAKWIRGHFEMCASVGFENDEVVTFRLADDEPTRDRRMRGVAFTFATSAHTDKFAVRQTFKREEQAACDPAQSSE